MAGPQSSILDTRTAPDPTSTSISQPPKSYTYYHAGPLFTLAELHANKLLSRAIHSQSSGKFIPIVPQDLEQRDTSPHSIRDEDIRTLLACDLALFTYDGPELDAGTVVEYMLAKMADVPSVILRTDFRGAGDQGGNGDSWNLMSSSWPRTVGVTVDAMLAYKTGLAQVAATGVEREAEKEGNDGKGKMTAGEFLVADVAARVVSAFEEVLKKPARLPKELRESVYQWLALMPGLRDGGDAENVKAMLKLCEQKTEKGLL